MCYSLVNCYRQYDLDGSTPFAPIHGYNPDISEYITFAWFDWVYYHDPKDPDKQLLGRWLGPAHDTGQGLAYYILTSAGKVKIRSTVSPISLPKQSEPDIALLMQKFTDQVDSIIGNFCNATQQKYPTCGDDPYDNLFEDDEFDDEDIEFQERNSDGTPMASASVLQTLVTHISMHRTRREYT